MYILRLFELLLILCSLFGCPYYNLFISQSHNSSWYRLLYSNSHYHCKYTIENIIASYFMMATNKNEVDINSIFFSTISVQKNGFLWIVLQLLLKNPFQILTINLPPSIAPLFTLFYISTHQLLVSSQSNYLLSVIFVHSFPLLLFQFKLSSSFTGCSNSCATVFIHNLTPSHSPQGARIIF